MLSSFISRVTPAGTLKDALDVGSQRVRAIADRVAKASLANQDGFALPAIPSVPGQPGQPGSAVDIESEMTNLADEELRFEATSKLLAKAYEQVRTSLKS
jgi:flagellar basal body rod protein FlgB